MCQVIPRQVVRVVDRRALVDVDGLPTWIDLAHVPSIGVGDYVLVHAGIALERVAPEEAQEILALYACLDETLDRATG